MPRQNATGIRSSIVRVGHSVNQSIPNAVVTVLNFNTELIDSDFSHDTGTGNSRLNCQSAGGFLMGFGLEWGASTAGTQRYAAIRVNGTTVIAEDRRSAGNSVTCGLSTLYPLSVGDYVEVVVFHDAGVSINVNGNTERSPVFWFAKVA